MAQDLEGISDLMGNSGSHGSPLFDFLTAFAPRKLKDLFRLCEYLYFNSAQIYAVLQKFATYPITEITYTTSNHALRKRYEKLHDKTLKTKRILYAAAIDKYVYGNGFYSIYSPFMRFLKCPHCSHLSNINSTEYKLNLKKLIFNFDCKNCKRAKVRAEVIDKKLFRQDMISIIRWDPKLMDIDYNPITGHREYFYTIPKELKERISKGNKHLINTMPMSFLEALQKDETYKFADGKLMHIKMDAPSGIEAQWGFPPLACTIKLFFFAAVLRKANEAIALDYVTPFRIISPKQASSNGDPVISISLANWSSTMKQDIKKWRRDPLHMMWSPIPCEITYMGGQARALMTLGEVQTAEDNIIAALGIPKEFIYGGFSAMGSGIQLRVLENQLIQQTGDLTDLLQWITDSVARLLGWATIEADLAPFKLVDDVQQKQMLLSLNQTSADGQPWVSQHTIGAAFEIVPEDERDLLKQEALDKIRFQQEIQQEVSKMQNTLSQQVQTQQMMGQQSMTYDPNALMQQAQPLAEQLMQFDPGTRQSQLRALKVKDYGLHAVVSSLISDQTTAQNAEAIAQYRQGGGAAAGGEAPPAPPVPPAGQ